MIELPFLSTFAAGGWLWTVAWQSTLCLTLGLAASLLFRRHAPRAHLLLVLATVAAVICPLLTATVRQMDWGILPARQNGPDQTDAGDRRPLPPVRTKLPTMLAANGEPGRPGDQTVSSQIGPLQFDRAGIDSTSPVPVSDRAFDSASEPIPLKPAPGETAGPAVEWPRTARVASHFFPMIGTCWIVVSLVLSMRLVASIRGGLRLAREAHEETSHPHLRAALCDVAAALGLRETPRLCLSASVRCPMIWCWGSRAVLLVPEGAPDQSVNWRSVFRHELAHLIRRDHWAALWLELLTIGLPWQPLAWLSRRRIAFLREQACDDWALSAGGEATEYAESLLHLVPQGGPASALAAVRSRESLKRRLKHVLAAAGTGVRIAPRVGPRWVAAAGCLALVAVAGIGFAQQRRATPTRNTETRAVDTSEPPQKSSDDVLPIHGRVVMPDGQPAAGATVQAIRVTYSDYDGKPPEHAVLTRLVADSNGEFRTTVDARAVKQVPSPISLWATLSGFGLAAHSITPADRGDTLSLRLVEDEPVRGRVINLEGQPVSGARVEVVEIRESTKEAVDEWFATASAHPGLTRFVTPEEPSDLGLQSANRPVLRIKPCPMMTNHLLPSATAGADGRFELTGLGRDRHVELAITGPRIAASSVSVVTRPMKTIRYQLGSLFEETVGSRFEHAALPSAPLEGIVTDEVTGEPIRGAVIIPTDVYLPHALLRVKGFLGRLVAGTSDAGGHYRLLGLQTRSESWLKVLVPNQPYPTIERVIVKASAALAPIRQDIRVRKGTWAVGRAYDRVTGKPVSGTVYFTAFRSNASALKYQRFQFKETDFLGNYPAGAAGSDGNYRIPVIPGRGVVCVQCSTGDYRPGFGRADIKEIADPRTMMTPLEGPIYDRLGPTTFHAVREIDVLPDAVETRVDLPVDPGQSVLLKFVDGRGRPLSGIDAYGLRLESRQVPGRRRSYVESDSATLAGSAVDETRTLWFKHRRTGLTKLVQFTPQTGETGRTIVLEPPAVVIGRLVSPESLPVADQEIECVFEPSPSRLPLIKTDSQGYFRQELPGGGPFMLVARPLSHACLVEQLMVASGEEVDLGSITIDRDDPLQPKVHRGPEKRRKAPANAAHSRDTAVNTNVLALSAMEGRAKGSPTMPAARVATARGTEKESRLPSKQETGDVLTVRGRVLRPDGQPAAGSKVSVRRDYYGDRAKGHGPLTMATAGPDGTFTISYRKSQFESDLANAARHVEIVAELDGFGVEWASGPQIDASRPLVLKLVPDLAIHGRILDLEGKPVPGVAINLLGIRAPKEGQDLGPWLGAVKSGTMRNGLIPFIGKSLFFDTESRPRTTTDRDGRFTLTGMGAERDIFLELRGEAIAYRQIDVATRKMEPVTRQLWFYDGTSHPPLRDQVFGADFTYEAAPTKSIVGTVRDAATGKPLAGVRVESAHLAGMIVHPNNVLRTRTDSEGRYRLDGVPKGNGPYRSGRNEILIVPNDDQPYFTRRIEVPDTPQFAPVTQDIELHRGIWVTGRVTDQVTGKPVASNLLYFPFLDNPFAKLPELTPGGRADFGSDPRYETRPDGTFRVVGLPGRAIVAAWANGGSYRKGKGAAEIKGMRKDGTFPTYRNPTVAHSSLYHALKEIDPAEGSLSVKCNFELDPGSTIRVHVVDREGKPVSGCRILGRTGPEVGDGQPQGSTFGIESLAANESRAVAILNRERNLGKFFVLKNDLKAPHTMTVTLEPCATLVGRLVDEEGIPFKGVELQASPAPGSYPWFFIPLVVCRNDGRFECKGLMPGTDYGLAVHGNEVKVQFPLKKIAIEPGKTIALGDVKLSRRPE